MKLEDALKAVYPITILPAEEGGYVATFSDLPGAITQAETLEELLVMAEDARRGWIEVVAELGQDIPAPGSGGSNADYSGKFNLRLPKSLHRELARRAEREGVSLNQWAVTLLAEGNKTG
ncbi:toxin-antitoxin system HicB family antitoxin [Deinococcus sp.]|uniref:toxin-antitoxin system HicB family antitoxin n=1 Tax=Deinococcus sp. TaxID=47478 RepID=UPI003B5A9993